MIIDLTTYVNKDNEVMKWSEAQVNKHIALGHVGTHLDTYNKTKIPLEYFKSNGVIFDVSNLDLIDIKDIDLKVIKENDFVLFKTLHINNYGYGCKKYFDNHPQLSDELINQLILKKIRFIGIDFPGIRQHQQHELADKLCEDNQIYVIENLKDLDKINSDNFTVYTMWLDDEIMTGLRCKVIIEQ